MTRPFRIFILIASIASSTSADDYNCPKHTKPIGDGVCAWYGNLPEKAADSQARIMEKCKGQKMGELNWHLPRLTKEEQRSKLADHVATRADIDHGHNHTHYGYFWIGLRRRSGCDSSGETNKNKCWYWTNDSSTLKWDTVIGTPFWARNHPREKGPDYEACAIAHIAEKTSHGTGRMEKMIVIEDAECSIPHIDVPPEYHSNASFDYLIGAVCTAHIPPTPREEFYQKWWFYFICAALFVVPLSSAGIVFLVLYLRNRKKQARRSRRSRRSQKRKSKRNREKDRHDDRPSLSDGQSETLDSLRPEQLSSFHPKSIKKSSGPISKTAANSSVIGLDEHPYSNVMPRSPKKVSAVAPKSGK